MPSFATFLSTGHLDLSTSTMQPPLAEYNQRKIQKMTSRIAGLVGQSGRRYLTEKVLQERGTPPRRVYLATYMRLKLYFNNI